MRERGSSGEARSLRLALCVAAFAPAGTAPAAADSYAADNHVWELACNEHGYLLRSQYPVVRFRGTGVAFEIVEGRETLALGKMCDATHSVFGEGSWCWANGGFQAEFRDHRIGFPRQELMCSGAAAEIADCGC